MSASDPFQRRISALIEAAGGKKPLARKLRLTDSAINSWLSGSKLFESKLHDACEKSGLSYAWLRDGVGRTEHELAKVAMNGNYNPALIAAHDAHSGRIAEEPLHLGEGGWRIVVRVLADRLTSTQIAEALNEILSHKEIDESVRNFASQILIAAQLPKLKR